MSYLNHINGEDGVEDNMRFAEMIVITLLVGTNKRNDVVFRLQIEAFKFVRTHKS